MQRRFQPERGHRRHSTLSPLLPFHFHRLRIGVTLVDAYGWHALYTPGHSGNFEREHGVEDHRARYNSQCLNQVVQTRKPVVGHFAGFTDLFVPVIHQGEVREILATGSFLMGPPTSTEILERWRELSAGHGHMGDPEFAGYVSMWLSTRELDAQGFATYQRLVECLAKLAAAEGEAEALGQELESLFREVTEITAVEQMWEAAQEMIDARTARTWSSKYAGDQRKELHLYGVPEYALVGLIGGTQDEVHPLEQAIRAHQFQKACTRLAREQSNLVAGRVGDHGVLFLMTAESSHSRSRSRLVDVGERVIQLARRQFQLKLHLGFAPSGGAASLPVRYQQSLAAAEKALARGLRSAQGTDEGARGEHALRDARDELAHHPSTPAGKLGARFERYMSVVAAHCAYRLEPISAHLEAGFERLAERFLASGALDRQMYDKLYEEIERKGKSATTLGELLATYRRTVSDLDQALQNPVVAHQERNLRGAVAYIREHATEPLTLAQVARVGGFSPAYFSRLFRRRERITFERYVASLRIERAKQMLARTNLSGARIAQLTGFSSSQYFNRVFKNETGQTPLDYRRRPT